MFKFLRNLGFRLTNPVGKKISDAWFGDLSIRQFNRMVDMINGAEDERALAAAGKALKDHFKEFQDADLYDFGQSIIAQRSYQIEATRRGEYPIMGQDIVWESGVK